MLARLSPLRPLSQPTMRVPEFITSGRDDGLDAQWQWQKPLAAVANVIRVPEFVTLAVTACDAGGVGGTPPTALAVAVVEIMPEFITLAVPGTLPMKRVLIPVADGRTLCPRHVSRSP